MSVISEPKRKKFEGKWYAFYSWSKSKTGANYIAEKLREQGWCVRVTKFTQGYKVWKGHVLAQPRKPMW